MHNLKNRTFGDFEGNQFVIQQSTQLGKSEAGLNSLMDDKSRSPSIATDQNNSYVKAGQGSRFFDADNLDNYDKQSNNSKSRSNSDF
jgi:hypothetical protein